METRTEEPTKLIDLLPDQKITVSFKSIADEDVILTDEEYEAAVSAAVRAAKRQKAAQLRSIEYAKSLEPLSYPPITAIELGKMLKKHGEATYPGFVIDDQNREIFKLLCQYFTHDPEFEAAGYSLRKGIALLGSIGCGKTTMMRLFQRNPTNDYVVKSCRAVADDYTKKSEEGGAYAIDYHSVLHECYPGDH